VLNSEQGSDSHDLDEEALAVLTGAHPIPRPPDGVHTRDLFFAVPICFNIR
jgi:hypothetical protein